MDFLADFRFEDSDLEYLADLRTGDGNPLFDEEFLDMLADLKLSCNVDAVAEGTVVFSNEPMIRVIGPILQAQLLETALLNIVHFQTLIATKTARICDAADGDPVIEFGLRRAQGIDGALSAARAAYIGGCKASSNVLAGKLLGIPVRGTHAHSWVMSFASEIEAFQAYAKAMPGNSILLVDTYDTLQGVQHAIEIGQRLREQGHDLAGIRLDSGDLAYLSIKARQLLDQAGFKEALIVASNNLDEYVIEDLKRQGAKISAWGVGTHLVTAFDEPALGGVYKLGAVTDESGNWQPRLKLSEQLAKTTIPGKLQIRRFKRDGKNVADMLFDELTGANNSTRIIDPKDGSRSKKLQGDEIGPDLLRPIMRDGELVAETESLSSIRQRVQDELKQLDSAVRRFRKPHEYPVGLEASLYERRQRMIEQARQG